MKNKETPINKDFNKTFYKEEGRELFGKHMTNFAYLIIILVFTFLAVGFANGSLKYLKRKMDDPFIKWVNLEIPYTLAPRIPEFINQLNVKFLQDSFLYENITGYNQLSIYYFKKNLQEIRQATGRTIDINNQILASILSKKNLITGNLWKDEFDIGIIVTEKLLQTLDYAEKIPSYILMSYPVAGKKYIEVPLPLVAVVRDLPGNNSFACTPYFYTKRNSVHCPFDVSSIYYQRELVYFVEGARTEAGYMAKEIYNQLLLDPLYDFYTDTLIQPNSDAINEGFNLIFYFNNDLADPSLIPLFNKKIHQNNAFSISGCLRIYNYDLAGFEKAPYIYDNLSIYFHELDRIREFAAYLLNEMELRIDMSQIESKENYNFVSKLTYFISGFLVIFSVLSIILFLTSILRVHIVKNKPNLGTFKAFGLENSLIVKIYSLLSLRFLLLAVITALPLAVIIGETGFFRFLFRISGTVIENDFKYFSLLSDIKTYVALLSILLANSVVLPLIIWKMLDRTPGDLIYNRD